MSKFETSLAGIGLALLAASPLQAQQIAEQGNSHAERMADEAGRTAGAATFCAIDEEDVEHFISLAQGKILSMVEDPVDKVVLKIRFQNELSVGTTREPKGGCDLFASIFPEKLRSME